MAERKRQAKRSKAKGKHAGGRPAKIDQTITYRNPTTQQEETITVGESVLRAIRIGVPQKYAAQAAGIDEDTVSRWIARGREWIGPDKDPQDAPESERSYAGFADGVVRAKGAAVAYFVGQLHRAAKNGSVRAAVEWLRTQAADEFKARIGVEFEGERKPPPLSREDDTRYRGAFAVAFADTLPEFDAAELAPEPEPEPEPDEEESD